MTLPCLFRRLPASAKGCIPRVLVGLLVASGGAAGIAAPLPAQTPASAPRLLRAGDVDTLPLRDLGRRIAYGPDSLQFGELRLPTAPDEPRVPIAIVLHGGCWISSFATVRNTAPLADALTRQGIATWNVEYRRSDSPGGGWPGTFQDAAAAADYVRVLARQFPIDTTRIVLLGHSAGGQLALWLAGRHRLAATSPLAGGMPLPVRGVLSLGGVTDLEEFAKRQPNGCGRGVSALLGAPPDSVPSRVREASPILRVPLGVRTAHIAGEDDRIAPAPVQQAYRRAAETAGDSTAVIVSVPGGHFEVIAPHTNAGQTVVGLALAAVGRSPRRSPPGSSPR
ncbi:alpha/beta hydrolase [Gemmatimonas phototrophica]|uniref:alpha/beta hydrolase n=1 Tax=Gemmatimonas phototrophica TaxID=1379270 RepID=UPI0009EDD4FF|nr:alpha/beta hydrolase [Gemmatimonas phototrophica]